MSPTVLADHYKATPPTMITNWETSLAAIVPQINSTGEYWRWAVWVAEKLEFFFFPKPIDWEHCDCNLIFQILLIFMCIFSPDDVKAYNVQENIEILCKCKTQSYLTRNFLNIGSVATFYAQLARP